MLVIRSLVIPEIVIGDNQGGRIGKCFQDEQWGSAWTRGGQAEARLPSVDENISTTRGVPCSYHPIDNNG